MIGLYYTAFSLLLAVAGPPLLLFKKKARVGLAQKLGSVPAGIQPKGTAKRVWFHTVSVGEFNATLPVINAFRQAHPDCQIFVSTTTGTGQALAQSKVGDWATVIYFPYDVPWAINAWLNAVQPDMVAIAETEIWPGFIYECHKRGVAVCCVNGRISPRSFKRYQSISSLVKPVISRFTAIAVQSEQEAFRYRALGAKQDSVIACGNTKFDGLRAVSPEERAQLQQQLNLSADDFVIVGGSTHEGEEAALLTALNRLMEQRASGSASRGRVRLIIAPRHPERFQRVFQIIEAAGFRVRCFTRAEAFERDNDVYVLDTIGQLLNYYSLATAAFVGGTLAPIGGHNIVEPCIYATPVICGPHVEKTRDVANALLDRKALLKIDTVDELVKALSDLRNSQTQRELIGAAGKHYLDQSQGAVARTSAVLDSVYQKRIGVVSSSQAVAIGAAAGVEKRPS
jgi:3-deoxy-D-manno-octulosonic-acid transferase